MLPDKIFHSSFDRSPIGQYLLAPTENLEILAVNEAFLSSVSRTRAEVEGRPLFSVFPNDPNDYGDTGAQDLARSIAMAIETGQSQKMVAQRYPIEMHADGRSWFEDMYWSATNTPIYDEEGSLICISHTTIDVTDQVQSALSLRESEGRLNAYVSATSEVLYRMSPDWRYMHELDGRNFLKTTAGWAEYRIEQYVHPEDLALARHKIQEAIHRKSVFELEHRVLRQDDSPGWTFSRAVPLLDASGNIREWIGSASDITQRKLAEERLKEGERRKDEFLAMLAHELRNPLAPISSAAELLRIAPLDKDRVRQTSEVIIRQIRHMSSLVDDLMDVSRVSRGLVKLESIPIDIRQIVGEAIEQVTPLIQGRQHHLRVDLAPRTTVVNGDRKRLVQVIANLLNNAAKYTPKGGEIEIRAEAHGNNVMVSVLDNGIGMQPDLVRRVFDLFSQAEVTSDRTSGGLGLGLPLVKNLIELHEGTVKCESDGPGKGSKFTVCIPRLNVPAEPRSVHEATRTLPAQQHSLRLLVVDDNVDGARTLAMLLDAAGHTTFVVHHPADALARAESEAFDVCLLDIGLPDLDGKELARRLRQMPGMAKSIMIAVTGYGQEQDREQTLEAGFALHLVKPLDAAQLFSFLGTLNAS